MEEVKVCRICLITGVKMYDLQSYPLDSYFGSIIGSNILTISNCPPLLCYQCAALVKKFYFLKHLFLKNQAVLYGLIDHSGKITASSLNQVSQQNQLSTHLSVYSLPVETDQDTLKTFIKKEPSSEDSRSNFIVKVKDENERDVLSDRNFCSDDDDEPLSARRVRKREESHHIYVEIEPIEAVAVSINPPPKKRRRVRSRNYRVTLGDNIEVIKLSVEEQMEEIKKRKESSNYMNSPFKCELCFKGFTDTHAWELHLAKHSSSAGEIECAICRFRFKTKYDLQKHLFYHKKKYRCKICSYISTNTTQAKHHDAEHNGITYDCKLCGQALTTHHKYVNHMRAKHPSLEFVCGICGFSSCSKLGLGRHRTLAHKDFLDKGGLIPEDGPFCQECDMRFLSTEAYKNHLEMCTRHTRNMYNNDCRICGESFNDETAKKMHHRKYHAKERPKYHRKTVTQKWPVKCEHCPEMMQNGRERMAHYRSSHPDKKYPVQKNFVCDICGKRFIGNAFLIYHRRTHTETGTHKCEQCGKTFFDKYILKRHVATHSDIRPHPCSVCFKAFKNKGALVRHFRVHTGQKPYECDICGKAFSQGNSRQLHITTVHLKQPAPYISKRRNKKLKNVDKETPAEHNV